MTLRFDSKFSQYILSKIFRKVMKKKLGCDIDAEIYNLSIYETTDDKHICLNANFQLSIAKEDADKLVDKL